MNPFETPVPKQEKENPKNRLHELLGDTEGSELSQRRIDSVPKSLPEKIRTKRVEKILSYFALVRQLRDRLEEQWHKDNKDSFTSNELTDEQVRARAKYVDSIESTKLGDMLEEWINGYEDLLAEEKDEEEKHNLEIMIDAAHELEAEIANWK